MKTCLFIFFMACSTYADILTGPRNKFEVALHEVEKKHDASRTGVGDHYLKTLQAMIAYMQRTGDEFGVRPAEEEIKRFSSARTVPEKPPAGSPELIIKAQEKYHEAVKKIDGEETSEIDQLASRYLTSLRAVHGRLKSGGRVNDANLVQEEIERVQNLGSGSAKPAASLRLPRDAAKALVFAYDFEEKEGRKIRDLSGRKRHGDLLGAKPSEKGGDGAAYEFTLDNDMLELESLNIGHAWTLIMRVHFPLGNGGSPRVLASNGYRQHHVMIDASDELCLTSDRAAGSGYFVKDLKGWHEIAVVGSYTKTLFYVDGKNVGAAPAIVKAPIKAIGNSAAGGRPCTGAISSVQLYRSSFSNEKIAQLFSLH